MRTISTIALFSLLPLVGACGDNSAGEQDFDIGFSALLGGEPADCANSVSGFGPNDDISVGVSDLRFYVGNLRFVDADGTVLPTRLAESEFQYTSDQGSVALIDLTANNQGSCAASAISLAEGTERTNERITGTVEGEPVGVLFEIGVPQAIMKETIATTTEESAPSPLGEMYWSWASGYRHFVFNFAVERDDGETGDGYLHIGSRDCASEGNLALEDRSVCGLIYTPKAELLSVDVTNQTVTVDLDSLLTDLDFVSPIYDENFEAIGEGPGVECHSAPARQPDCELVFGSLGINAQSGTASAESNVVFGM